VDFIAQSHLADANLFGAGISAAAKYWLPNAFFGRGRGIDPSGEGALPTLVSGLDQALARMPNRPEAYYYKGRALVLLHRRREAQASFKKALALDPHFVPARFFLSELLAESDRNGKQAEALRSDSYAEGSWQSQWLRGHTAVKARRWDDAVLAFGTLYEQHNVKDEPYLGASVENLLQYGKALMGANELYSAQRVFSVARYLWRDAAEPCLLLAKAYYAADGKAEAEKVLKALHTRRLPEGAAALISAFYLALEDHERALSWAAEIPSEALRACSRSAARFQQKHLEEAKAEARKAIDADGSLPWAYYLLGAALMEQSSSSEAYWAFQRAVDLDDSFVPGYVGLGAALYRQGKPEEGEAAFRKAIERDPSFTEAPVALVRELLGRGELEKAEAVFLEALARSHDLPDIHASLGYVYLMMGRHDEAIEALDASIRLEPLQSAAHHYLALVYMDLERSGPAIAQFRQALDYNPYEHQTNRTLLKLLMSEELLGCEAELDKLIDSFENRLGSLEIPSTARLAEATVALARTHRGSHEDLAHAVQVARKAVEASKRHDPELLVVLGRALSQSDRTDEAVRIVEEACRLPRESRRSGVCMFLEERLERYRRAAFPRLPSYRSADAALATQDTTVLVPRGATWRYLLGTGEPSQELLAWTTRGFDDGTWQTGQSAFGYLNSDLGTSVREMRGRCTTLYVRGTFRLEDPGRFTRFVLRLWADCGAVAYVNGTELDRVRVSKKDEDAWLPHDAVAGWWVEDPVMPVEVEVPAGILRPGENVLAVQGLTLSRYHWDFCLLPVLTAERAPEPRRDAELLEAVRRAAAPEDAGRLAYLEGRILQRHDKHTEAEARFRAALSADGYQPLPVLRLAEVLLASGNAPGAEEVLHAALSEGLVGDPGLWDCWIAVSLAHLGRTPGAILADYPVAEGEGGPVGEDIRWVMDRLAAGETIRINCGGGDYRTAMGIQWSRDRCFREGQTYATRLSREDRAALKDLPLYTSKRYSRHPPGGPVYRIPLPPGQYRVTLHSAEFVHGILIDGVRRFDVLLEGRCVREEYEPPRRTPGKLPFVIPVQDGLLDIGYAQGSSSFPMISAFEIERAD
jgi:tetratricopeptide (TPR) repeat protein